MDEWRTALNFSRCHSWRSIAYSASRIPSYPGIYVFTPSVGRLRDGDVLYVGRTDTTLRDRLWGYITNRNRHKGAHFLRSEVRSRGPQNVFVRWAIWGDPREYEGELIADLAPWFNTRFEALRMNT
ncbi:MAG: hypothetical protein AAGF12_21965 [Myxococcota bacterium]